MDIIEIQDIVKYTIGISILWFIGIMGGDILMTAMHIGIVYSVLEWIGGEGPPPAGGT